MIPINIEKFLACKCGNKRLTVAMTENKSLAFLCDACRSVVVVMDKWPDEDMLNQECDACSNPGCKVHNKDKSHKEMN